eukprot:gb/GECH01001698.1/.p1 GENE.gb/GECH01001698.1/~~gb/GECH01001698.1/.p1  ORF type:complete len:256 (+),score=50.71 gb/GECH01001698.1/:1-768(+)
MAKSKYEYVKNFESTDHLLPSCWLVVRIDGRYFTRFTTQHGFVKPNDRRGIELMNRCAQNVMKEFPDIILAYGQSDEYSFVLKKNTKLFKRRSSKISTNFVSLFASSYVFHWSEYFPDTKLQLPPTFDGRVVCYPSDTILRDYLSWRQVDCHINNLYNTTFWTLVNQGNLSNIEAEERLKGTVSSDKNEILFSEFGINYNDEDPMFKKGSVLLCRRVPIEQQRKDKTVIKNKQRIVVLHQDIISDSFWRENPILQ